MGSIVGRVIEEFDSHKGLRVENKRAGFDGRLSSSGGALQSGGESSRSRQGGNGLAIGFGLRLGLCVADWRERSSKWVDDEWGGWSCDGITRFQDMLVSSMLRFEGDGNSVMGFDGTIKKGAAIAAPTAAVMETANEFNDANSGGDGSLNFKQRSYCSFI
ncbi:hypothetical protein F0562_015340 [Nyssa sinensis]|uniref:Uncharacterized protein n=1 Tax=Nyssa sinensis TaxID=561372 RepID=A0A5J4ZL49_9ASTE|nr:hypothetical protein F0562_015340 [Nyssa sinensis]